MSVKHIDYLKIKPSKFLTVEIRPIRCLIDTPSGLTRTAKWMTHEHWKELRLLLNEIADHYEKEKQTLKVTQDVKCNEHNLKDGKLIRIGYMFVANCSCSCHYLVPRDDATWTDDEDEDDSGQHMKLRDKGGKYKPLTPCGERLVVSVRLQEVKPKSSSQSLESASDRGGTVPMSPMAADKQLVKALDRSFVVTNTISDYFTSSEKASQGSVLPSVPRQSASPDTAGTDEQRNLRNMAVKSRLRRQKRKRDPTETRDINSDNKNPNRRQVKKSMFDTSSEGVVEDDGNVYRHVEQNPKFYTVETKELFCDSKEGIKKEVLTSGDEWIKTEEMSFSNEWMEKEIVNHVSPDKHINTCISLSRCEKEFNSNDKDFDPEMCIYARNSEYSVENETDLVPTNNNRVSVGYDSIKTETDDDVSCRVTEEPFNCFDRYVREFSKSDIKSNLTFTTDDDGKGFVYPNLISKYQSTPVYQPSDIHEKDGEKLSHRALSPIVGRKQKHTCETTDSFMFSSSSQVRKYPRRRRLRQCSNEDSPRRIEQEHSSNHSNVSEQPLPVKIPLKYLHNTSLSPEVQSPIKSRVAKTKSKRICALFGDSEETQQEEQTSNLEEEYVPTALGSEYCDQENTSAQTSFNPTPIVQTSDSVKELDSNEENLSCRRSKRLRGKEWMVPYLYNENVWRISPSKKTVQPKKNVGEMQKLLITNDEMFSDTQVSDSQIDTEELHSPCEKKERTKTSPSKKMLHAKKVVSKVKKELQIMNDEVLNDSQLTDSQKERELLDLPWEKKKIPNASPSKKPNASPSKKTLQATKVVRKVKKEKQIVNDEMLNDSQLTDSQKERELLHLSWEKKKRTRTSPSKKSLQATKVDRKVEKEIMNDEMSKDSQRIDSKNKKRELLHSPCEKKEKTRTSPSKKMLQAKKVVSKAKKELQIMNDEVLNDSQLTDSQKERELLDLPWEKKKITSTSPLKKTVRAKKVDSWEVNKTQSPDDSQLTDLSESSQKLDFKLKKKRLRIREPSKTKTPKMNRQVKQKLPKNKLSDGSQSLSEDSCSQKRVVKRRGKVKNRIIESERIKEAKKVIREVEKEMAEMSRQTLDDETLSLTPVISHEEVSFNYEKKKIAESLVKKKYKKRTTTVVSNQPTLKDCWLMKSLTMATDRKKCQKHSSKVKSTNNFSDKDMFADSSVTNNSCASDCNEVSGPVSASDHGQQNTSDSLFTDDSYSQRFSDIDDLPALEGIEGDHCESQSHAVNVQGTKESDPGGSFTDSDDSALSPLKDALAIPSLLEESQGHTSNQVENSVVVTEERPRNVSKALQLCGQKLKNTSLQELEDRLTEAHPYLHLIMKGKGSNARHDIFKEDGRACREMFNELIYGAFLEEQIEFTIEFLQKKYLEGLTDAMNDSSRSRRYLWKVLAPSFFIKLVVDNENVDHDIAEHILSEISLHVD